MGREALTETASAAHATLSADHSICGNAFSSRALGASSETSCDDDITVLTRILQPQPRKEATSCGRAASARPHTGKMARGRAGARAPSVKGASNTHASCRIPHGAFA